MAIVLNGATSGNVTIDANAISGTSVITLPVGSGTFPLMTLSTAVATTSGTAIDYTSIPSWVKKITIMFNGVSTNGTSNLYLQLGDSGGIETTGYLGAYVQLGTAAASANQPTSAFTLNSAMAAAGITHGIVVLTTLGSNIWSCSYNMSRSDVNQSYFGSGTKPLSDVLTQIRITTANGTDTFDLGSVNILMEGH
jgi:hypothetical protein